MSHSPLKMFRDYQYKHVLVIGQGPVDTIARSLGFSKVSSKLGTFIVGGSKNFNR